MNLSIFDTFRLTVAEQTLGVYGIVAQHPGKPAVAHRFRADDKVNLYSASKTFTSIAIGIALDEKRFSLDDSVLGFFPEFASAASAGSDKITLRNLLHMASGKPVFWFSCSEEEQLSSPVDWAERFFREPLLTTPGASFVYSNACTYMLGRVLQRVTGLTLRDYLVTRLFTPLGIHNPQWHTCPRGHTIAATGLHLTTAELHRLGLLLVQNGAFDGRHIVSPDYIRALHTDTITPPWQDPENRAGYGYHIWRCTPPNTYRADGKYGQFSIIFQDLNLVVTITSHCERNCNDILRAVYRDILPRI